MEVQEKLYTSGCWWNASILIPGGHDPQTSGRPVFSFILLKYDWLIIENEHSVHMQNMGRT